MSLVYGPVKSWRLGRSIGIDPICMEPKVCTFNCIYCQLGRRGIVTEERSVFVKGDEMKDQLVSLLKKGVRADVITFSGTGEPTLAANLGELVALVNNVTGIPTAMLTNSSMLRNPEVRDAARRFDVLVVKLDASSESAYKAVNRPHPSMDHQKLLKGIELMREEFDGSFRLQLMFVSENLDEAPAIAELCEKIAPDLVYLNTPLRPSMTRPLSRREMHSIPRFFRKFQTRMVYDARPR
ncbi:MAG: radical SAM protein [Methanomassiliicoccales archaeon]|nr:radical SAM protein [Methanomassiliicoccales archaeon]